jgi:hypothetical protein
VAQAEAKLMAALATLHEDAAFARALRPAPGLALPAPVLDRLRSESPALAARLDCLGATRHGLPPASALPLALREVLRRPAALIDRACLVLGLAAAIRSLGPVFLASELQSLARGAGEAAIPLAVEVSRLLPPAVPDDRSTGLDDRSTGLDERSGEDALLDSGRSLFSAWALARFGIAGRWLTLRWDVEPADLDAPPPEAAVEAVLEGVQAIDGRAAP